MSRIIVLTLCLLVLGLEAWGAASIQSALLILGEYIKQARRQYVLNPNQAEEPLFLPDTSWLNKNFNIDTNDPATFGQIAATIQRIINPSIRAVLFQTVGSHALAHPE